jgi:hypothetical protein
MAMMTCSKAAISAMPGVPNFRDFPVDNLRPSR